MLHVRVFHYLSLGQRRVPYDDGARRHGADYILTAVLLASLLGGSSKAIQEWSDGFKEGVPTTLPIDCNSEIFS